MRNKQWQQDICDNLNTNKEEQLKKEPPTPGTTDGLYYFHSTETLPLILMQIKIMNLC